MDFPLGAPIRLQEVGGGTGESVAQVEGCVGVCHKGNSKAFILKNLYCVYV